MNEDEKKNSILKEKQNTYKCTYALIQFWLKRTFVVVIGIVVARTGKNSSPRTKNNYTNNNRQKQIRKNKKIQNLNTHALQQQFISTRPTKTLTIVYSCCWTKRLSVTTINDIYVVCMYVHMFVCLGMYIHM